MKQHLKREKQVDNSNKKFLKKKLKERITVDLPRIFEDASITQL